MTNTAQTWPALSLAEATARLCAAGERFEIETIEIDGRATQTWKNALADLGALAEHARGHGDRTFVVLEDERMSYEGWYRATAALAEDLVRRGVSRGDRVALAMRNLPEWPVAYFAAVTIGAIVVPLNAWWTAAELAYGLSDCGARVLIIDGERLERIAPSLTNLTGLEHVITARAQADALAGDALETIIDTPSHYDRLPDRAIPHAALQPDQPATIFYTSGTTSSPKGVVGSHRNAVTNILSSGFVAARAALRRGAAYAAPPPKSILLSVPLFHVTGCNARMLGLMSNGDTLVMMRKWDVLEAFALIEREKISNAGGVPTIAWQLIDHPDRARFDLSSLESISYGGAPAAPDLVRRIQGELGVLPGFGWGMTETGATVTLHTGEDYLARPDSAGPAVAVADLRIVDPESLADRPVGEVGELWARGPMIAQGYWNRPEETAETFVDGWVRTGDLARLDDEGFLYLVDRLKDMVIRGGENIYSIEVENILYDHPAVTDAALIGKPDRTLGEVPVAIVHLAKDATADEDELRDWVRARLAAFKVPARIHFSEELLPRNANGKIVKSQLLHFLAEG